ncbi:MAG: hypothetical protein RR531_12380 [Longicatena sp.]
MTKELKEYIRKKMVEYSENYPPTLISDNDIDEMTDDVVNLANQIPDRNIDYVIEGYLYGKTHQC